MTLESTQNGDQVQENVSEQKESAREYSDIEQKAIEQGWVPQEEFEGDEKEFIDAPEFVRRGELFSKIEHQSKEVKQLRQALDALKEHHSKTKEIEFKRALKQLDTARKQAVVDGEHERAFALEEKIDEVKIEKAEFDADVERIPTAAPKSDPVFDSWQSNNSWYGKDKAMTSFANALGQELREKVLAGEMDKEEVFTLIGKEVRQEFKHKFQNPKASRSSAVESSSRGSGGNSGSFKMSETERAIMQKIVRTGVMTEAQYVKELQANREV